jgi:hypothetical protein
MKTNKISIWAIAITIALVSCNTTKEEEQKKEGNVVEQKDDNKGSTSDAKKVMTVKEAKAFFNADAANSGKEITVSGYSWGTNNRMGGEVLLNLGDVKLEGFKQATFSCVFTKEKADAVKIIVKDAMVTVTGKIKSGSGGVELIDCSMGQ